MNQGYWNFMFWVIFLRPERQQVEAMAANHPLVMTELAEIERSMERYAAENAVEAPENLKERILNSLVTNLADDRIFGSNQDDAGRIKIVPFKAERSLNSL